MDVLIFQDPLRTYFHHFMESQEGFHKHPDVSNSILLPRTPPLAGSAGCSIGIAILGQGSSNEVNPRKTNMTKENPPFEDVFPIEHARHSNVMLVFLGV